MAQDGDYTWDTRPSESGAPARLTVATCQIPVTHDIARNLEHIEGLIARAAAAGADVAHFPECALSGYGPADWPHWRDFEWSALAGARSQVGAAARAAGIWVVIGSVHRTDPDARPTNALLVFDRRGVMVGRYDKRRCSINDLRAFAPGDRQLTVEIEGVRCGFLICLDWAFPELWADYAGQVELVFHSCVSDHSRRDRNAAHTIPPLMQSHAWLHHYAISLSNSCRPSQDFPSLWIERSGHVGGVAARDRPGLVINALADDPAQDRFFAMVRGFRRAASDGSLYRPPDHNPEPQGGFG